eukprot:scaffold49762_cov63-Phaeocystis_antarctica.AAC.2
MERRAGPARGRKRRTWRKRPARPPQWWRQRAAWQACLLNCTSLRRCPRYRFPRRPRQPPELRESAVCPTAHIRHPGGFT